MKKITLLLFAFITSIWSVNAQSLINITTSGGSYGTEKWVSITTEADGAGTQVWGQGDGSYGNGAGLINEDISIAPGTYYVNCYDKYDDGWDGTLIAVTSYSNTIGDNGGVSPDDDNDVDSSAAWETPADELEASFVIVVPDPPSCSPVSGVTVAPVSGTDVTIAWTAGDSETGWSYEYGATGFTQGDGTSGTTSTTSVDISGLTPGSVYDIYIQANCTGEDSTWVMVTFTMPIAGDNIVTAVPITPSAAGTGCDTVGFTLNFSSDGTTDSGLDGSCNNSNTGLDQFFTWTATTDALLFNDAEPGNPGIVVRDLAGNEISCAETFAADDSILSGWEIGDDLIIQIYDYGTSVSDVAFCLEEFSMPETPNCAENLSPTDGATNVAIPQAVISISWDAPATGVAPTGYEVFLGTTSGALNSLGDTEETTVSITNLNYATTYYWKVVSKNGVSVAADCSESSFTTQSASVPFISSFENYPSGWFEAAGAYGSPAGTTSTFTQGDFGNDTENANGKSAKVNIYGTGTDEYLVSPILDLSSGTHYLNFDLALTAYNATTAATLGADDYLALLVTQDAGTTWQELTRWDSDSTLGNTGDPIDEIELTGYGAEVQFAFYAFSDTSNVDNDLFIDNFQITAVSLAPVTDPTEAAPTPPARETADVVSLFSDAYTDVTLTELPTDWSDVTTFEATTVASDNVWKLSGLEFLGMVTNYDTGIDVSSMEKLHIDYWVPTGVENELLVKIVNTVDGGEDVESLGTTVAGSWQSIDLDMTGFDGGNLANTEKITQILIDAVDRAATVYVDNFYFYKEPSTTSDIIFITELADPNDNAAARYVEIYNGGTSDVDLTGWTLRRYTNGNAEPQTTGEDLTPIGSLAPGAIAIIAANGTAFEAAFGMAADISAGTGGPADSNGDDQIYITDASDTIVDFFGVPGEDGSGTDHEFEDGRAERKASVTQGTATWDVNEWNIDNDAGAGDGALDVDGGFDPGVWIGADTSGVENESLITLNMYPNPASDVLNISSQSTINMVEIFNVLGQKVITMQVEDTSAEINVSNLNAGIYLIKYEINNSTSTKKFVKN
ncbi:lamin tail domain-containing protein [Polaribacter sp.]|nr:lamin tail domain-containing protein [Polaribacter sp.]